MKGNAIMAKKTREPGYYVLTWTRKDEPYQNRIVKVNRKHEKYPQSWQFAGDNLKRNVYDSVQGNTITWTPLTDGEYVLTCTQNEREYRMNVRIDMRTGSTIQHFPWGTEYFPLDILFETRGSSDWQAFPVEDADSIIEQPPWDE